MRRKGLIAGAIIGAAMLPACGQREDAREAIAPSAAGVSAIEAARPAGPRPVGVRRMAAEGLDAWLFYPASGAGDGTAEPEPDEDYRRNLARRFGPQAAADLVAAHGAARWNAPPVSGSFPLIVFAPGASLGARDYRALLVELASHGHVVAALHPMGSPAADEARYSEAADEIAAAARALAGDAHIGVGLRPGCAVAAGHSIGGAAAVLAMTRSPAFVAAINIDGDYAGASRTTARHLPILYLTGENEDEGQRSRARRDADWALVANGNPQARRIGESRLRHLDMLDAALLPALSMPADKRANRFGPLGGLEAHRRIGAALTGFLARAMRSCGAG